ncbi:MAG: AAA family ATPase [Phenylobacterium sp.]|uniref:ATP-dependent nuclease n=1 Tax=Phenylobacterium sp. TaxID=1871053 RepID=UPI00271C4FF7|nr:AAA family ATPase [Phenylobacterium sp.]MDO8409486.1 AAA family ATPase [Phenylobacterium sp.]
MISEISIRNFRSIGSADIRGDWITTFVGANDAGKSNVLRALNLFFNGETNPGEKFSFARDYNQFAEARQRRAPQIEVTLTITLPASYQREDKPAEVRWTKVWRLEGEVARMETRAYADGSEFVARSKVPALLDRIQYTYIPAIKDRAFFADLNGRLYEVLASVAKEPLQDSAGAFQEQLGAQLRELLESIQTAFGGEASMRLPDDLRAIFESLEINSGEVPLSRRGDGIKIRHIPMILRFIAKKRDDLLTHGGVKYTHIWGFEEPENNVEMSAAFAMASELVDLVADSDAFQLFLTTHSPIFYRLDQQARANPDWVVSHFVDKFEGSTRIASKAPDDVDETMGLMPLVAPYVAKAKARFDEVEAELRLARELADQKKPMLFVEGASDKRVLKKAWELFSGKAPDAIHVCDGSGAYGGANALRSRALAWLLTVRHRPVKDRVPAIALFDADPAGTEARVMLAEDIARLDVGLPIFKVLALPAPPVLVPLLKKGFRLPIDLEAYLTDDMWQACSDKAWLEEVEDPERRLSSTMVRKLAKGGASPYAGLEAAELLRLGSKFSDNGKDRVSRQLANMKDAPARVQLAAFEPMITQISAHLTA